MVKQARRQEQISRRGIFHDIGATVATLSTKGNADILVHRFLKQVFNASSDGEIRVIIRKFIILNNN